MERPKVEKELRTLLVVEDNNEIRQYLKSKLATIYNVFDCDNGHEALEIIHRREIDLVISDVMMPVMDGIELCKAIKSNIEINHIPVILLTAHVSDTHVKTDCLRVPMIMYSNRLILIYYWRVFKTY